MTERIRDMIEKYAIQEGMEDEFEQDINQHILSIVDKVVDKEIHEWEFPETRDDAEMMAYRILNRI